MAKTIRTPSAKCVDCGQACWGRTQHGKQAEPRCHACAVALRSTWSKDNGIRICCEPDCDNEAPHRKTTRCGACHYRWQKQYGKQHTATCVVCEQQYTTHRKPRGQACCSTKCRQALAQPMATAAPRAPRPRTVRTRQCEWCLALHFDRTKMCSDKCRTESAQSRSRAQRGALRVAYEENDWACCCRSPAVQHNPHRKRMPDLARKRLRRLPGDTDR